MSTLPVLIRLKYSPLLFLIIVRIAPVSLRARHIRAVLAVSTFTRDKLLPVPSLFNLFTLSDKSLP